jgi:L-2-hydroxyglutarate oxidase LhgO
VERVDTVVVGAGVVGLAVARALAQAGREVVVLEKELGIGTGVSSRNSEVIHAGMYYAPGSLKARLCVRGKALLYDLCRARGVGFNNCGKLIVATDPAQDAGLQKIFASGQTNGVPLQWLSAAEATAREPNLACTSALWSPTTGIVDSHGFMLALHGDLEAAGGMVAFGSAFEAAQALDAAQGGGFEVQAAGMTLHCRHLINSAALHATQVARFIGGLDAVYIPKAHYAKGNYYTLAGKAPFACLVYPAPQDAWLGVHLTLDLGGQAKFGPDLEWLDVTDPDEIDYTVDPQRADSFYAEVRRYWPGLPDGALTPSYSGVRPKIYGPGEKAPDFLIQTVDTHGLPGLVNLFGIESPGLTSSMAIGEHVRDALLGA